MIMTEIQRLEDEVKGIFPEATVMCDSTDRPQGHSWLDIRFGDRHFAIEHRPGTGSNKGFGLHAKKDAAYGEHPDFVSEDADECLSLLFTLVTIEREEACA